MRRQRGKQWGVWGIALWGVTSPSERKRDSMNNRWQSRAARTHVHTIHVYFCAHWTWNTVLLLNDSKRPWQQSGCPHSVSQKRCSWKNPATSQWIQSMHVNPSAYVTVSPCVNWETGVTCQHVKAVNLHQRERCVAYRQQHKQFKVPVYTMSVNWDWEPVMQMRQQQSYYNHFKN